MSLLALTDRRDLATLGLAGLSAILLTWVSTVAPLFAIAVGLIVLLTAITLATGLDRMTEFAFTMAMVLVPLNLLRPVSSLSFITIADLFLVIGSATLIPTIFTAPLRIPNTYVAGAALLVAWGSISSLMANDPVVSFNRMLRFAVAALLLPVLFLYWRPTVSVMGKLAAGYLLGTAISVLYALGEGAVVTNRYIGLTTHVNYLGLSCLLAASLVPFVRAARPDLATLANATGVLAVAGVWMSGSRAAFLVLIAVAVLYPLIERSLMAGWVLLFGATGALALSDRLLSTSGTNALGRLLGNGDALGSNQGRERELSEATDLFLSSPLFGVGFEDVKAAHNIFLQLATAAGVVGLLGFLLLLWPSIKTLFLTGIGPLRLLGYPALAYLLDGMVSPNLWDRMIWGPLALSYVAYVYMTMPGFTVPDDGTTPAGSAPRRRAPTDSALRPDAATRAINTSGRHRRDTAPSVLPLTAEPLGTAGPTQDR